MSAIPTKVPPSEFDQAPLYPSQPPVVPPYSQQPPEAPGFNQAPMYPQPYYEPAPPYSAQAPTYTQNAPVAPPQVHSYPQQATSDGVYTQPMYPQQAFPSGFPQQQQPAQVVIRAPELGDTPMRMTCLNCRHEILSSVSTECTAGQHIAFAIMCALGFCTFFTWLCSCIPYCISSCSAVRHECPNCHAHLGTYNR